CRPLTQLHGPADVGHATGHAEQRSGAVDETGPDQPNPRGHGGNRRIRFVARTYQRDSDAGQAKRNLAIKKEETTRGTKSTKSFVPFCASCGYIPLFSSTGLLSGVCR